jgi:hypothetical protein
MLGLYMGEGGLYSGRDLYLEVFSMLLLQYKPGSHMPVVCLRYCLQPLMHTVHSFVNYLVELLTMAQPWYLSWSMLPNPLQSNRMLSCKPHCNIVPQYCNFDRQIALSNLQLTRTNIAS